MQFIFPNSMWPIWAAMALAVWAALAWGIYVLERRRKARITQFVEAALAPRLLHGYDESIRKPLAWLALAGFALLALAFAQPHWGQTQEETLHESRDILVLLDTSESMRADDFPPSRLMCAKSSIALLAEQSPEDRFGLIAFAGAAILQCPFTLDRSYFRAVLDSVDTHTISQKGTDLAVALRVARKLLDDERERGAASEPNSRAVLFVSDGEQVSGDTMAAVQELAEYARVFALGIGSPGGALVPPPEWSPCQTDASGEGSHLSILDEENLANMARAGGGEYVRAQSPDWNAGQLKALFRSIAARNVDSEMRSHQTNRYQWPLLGAILCFASEGFWIVLMPLVRARRMRRETKQQPQAPSPARRFHPTALLVAACLLAGAAGAGAESFSARLKHGNAFVRSGDAEQALPLFRELQIEEPDSPFLQYAIGCAYYASAEQHATVDSFEDAAAAFEHARAAFEQAAAESEGIFHRNAAFNGVNCAARTAIMGVHRGDIEQIVPAFRKAIEGYHALLAQYPDFKEARQNLDHVQYQLKKLLQQPPEQEQKPAPDVGSHAGQGPQPNEQPESKTTESQQEQPKQELPESSQPESSGKDGEESPEKEHDAAPMDASEPNTKANGHSIDRRAAEAILQSLEDIDQREQRLMRSGPPEQRTRREWW